MKAVTARISAATAPAKTVLPPATGSPHAQQPAVHARTGTKVLTASRSAVAMIVRVMISKNGMILNRAATVMTAHAVISVTRNHSVVMRVAKASRSAAVKTGPAATAMIGSVFLGLVVDDTIHFLHAFEAARRTSLDTVAAVSTAFARSGRAIVVTSIVLAVGFGAGAFGDLSSTIEFAVVASSVVVVALIGDLVALPALLIFFDRSRASSRASLVPAHPAEAAV